MEREERKDTKERKGKERKGREEGKGQKKRK